MQTVGLRPANAQVDFAVPSVSDYEKQKGFCVIDAQVREPAHGNLPAIRADREDPERELQDVFAQRIACALQDHPHLAVPIFPGCLVAGFGGAVDGPSVSSRGVLFYEQFEYMLLSGLSPAATGLSRHSQCSAEARPVAEVTSGRQWPWKLVARPEIRYIHCTGHNSSGSPEAGTVWLAAHARELLRDFEVAELLSLIHHAWDGCGGAWLYRDDALARARQWLADLDRTISDRTLLAVLFEIEAYAAFASVLSKLDVVAGGMFAGNWIEVGHLPLAVLRPTELCQPRRLFEELGNVPRRGFAPIVVNDSLSVADGNHRLIATWLWNFLCSCADLPWDVNSTACQMAVANFVSDNELHPVLIYEILGHLATFIEEDFGLERLRPFVSPRSVVDRLPATVLPEHLSGAVYKDPYDNGEQILRAQPLLYHHMSLAPDTVLAPRASYHFTDRVLLPWFRILP